VNFPLYIAKRYIFSKSKNNAITIISRIALSGIIIGSLSLFVVLSVFSGLRDFSLTFSNDSDPDIKVSALKGKSFLVSASQENQIKKIDGILNYSKIIEERVLFSFNEKQQITYLKGVDSNFVAINSLPKKLFNGVWLKPNTTQAVIGYGIAQKLSLGLLDVNNPLEVFVPKPGKGQIESEDQFNKDYLIPTGIYAISEELDNKYVFVDLELAQELMGFEPNQVTGIEFKINPNADENHIISEIKKVFKNSVDVKTRAQLNASLYKMLNTENFVLYLIFTLVIIMILFAFAGAIFMVIIDKKDNLKTLFSLGTEVKSLRRIFLIYGISICAIGGIIGIAIGALTVFLQHQFELIMITESLAYPVVFNFKNVLIVFTTIVSLGCIATLIASSRVSEKLFD
jgi:lipoprotein-releasing system permease protein